jgi:hypothetical protein
MNCTVVSLVTWLIARPDNCDRTGDSGQIRSGTGEES